MSPLQTLTRPGTDLSIERRLRLENSVIVANRKMAEVMPGFYLSRTNDGGTLAVTEKEGMYGIVLEIIYHSNEGETFTSQIFPTDLASKSMEKYSPVTKENILVVPDWNLSKETIDTKVDRAITRQAKLLETLPENLKRIIKPYGYLRGD